MAIEVIDGFSIKKNVPIDDRTNVQDLATRDAINVNFRHIGLKCYVIDLDKEFQLKSGVTNSNWVDVTSGVAGVTGATSNVFLQDETNLGITPVSGSSNSSSGFFSFISNGTGNTASGVYSTASGQDTLASGLVSHAEGYETTAEGTFSHAQGFRTTASGPFGHSEGNQTTASGTFSHAEGYLTTASGTFGHTEGQLTFVSGQFSHAEGQRTSATTSGDHAEGIGSLSSGGQSHAEGYETTASGTQAHAEGVQSTASGNYGSHAEGRQTIASGNSAHAEGNQTTASGDQSHAEGSGTLASNIRSHAEGDGTTASGAYAHAEGKNSIASGEGAHAEGRNTTASDYVSHAEGYYTTASGDASHAEGRNTTATNDQSHSQGYNTTSTGAQSHTEGYKTTASGGQSHAEGINTVASGNYSSHAEGYYTTASGEYGSHAEGANTTTTGNYGAHAEGSTTLASGNASHAEGDSTTASGDQSHSEGQLTTASGDHSHAEGSNTTAQGPRSHAEGRNTTAVGGSSHTEGRYTISPGGYSHAGGENSVSSGQTSFIHSYHSTVEAHQATILGGRHSRLMSGATGSTILGGTGITGATADTVYGVNFEAQASISAATFYSGSTDIGDIIANTAGALVKSPFSGNAVNGAIVTISGSNISTGFYSLAEGANNTATGDFSHAEGSYNYVSGTSAHVEGNDNTASATNAHAEGASTVASAINSHSQGNQTSAVGLQSHAEGYKTTASGSTSHAEGFYTIASGDFGSHAEGRYTTTIGRASHAEGRSTTAYGWYSHAEGQNTLANGGQSHAEGNNTTAYGFWSHAEGYNTSAMGQPSHAEGRYTTASGDESHAEGRSTIAAGDASHAEGRETVASGLRSHAEGFQTTASSPQSHAEGGATTASNNYAHAEGQGTTAQGQNSHSQNHDTQAAGENSHAGGYKSSALGYNSFIHSSGSTVNSSEGAILGGSGNTLTANADRSIILGGGDITGDQPDTVYGINFNASENISGATFYSGSTNLADLISSGTNIFNSNGAISSHRELSGGDDYNLFFGASESRLKHAGFRTNDGMFFNNIGSGTTGFGGYIDFTTASSDSSGQTHAGLYFNSFPTKTGDSAGFDTNQGSNREWNYFGVPVKTGIGKVSFRANAGYPAHFSSITRSEIALRGEVTGVSATRIGIIHRRTYSSSTTYQGFYIYPDGVSQSGTTIRESYTGRGLKFYNRADDESNVSWETDDDNIPSIGLIKENLPSAYISTTFNALTGLTASSGLTVGAWYLFSAQTKHLVLNTPEVHSGSSEYLLAQAMAPDQLNSTVKSTIYPQDIIEYNFEDTICEDGVTPREGRIIYRKDPEKNLTTYYDWRNVVFRRWNVLGYKYDAAVSASTSIVSANTSSTVDASPSAYREYLINFSAITTNDASPQLTITNGGTSITRELLTEENESIAEDGLSSYDTSWVYYNSILDKLCISDYGTYDTEITNKYLSWSSGGTFSIGKSTLVIDDNDFVDYHTFSVSDGGSQSNMFIDKRGDSVSENYNNIVFVRDHANVNNVRIGPGSYQCTFNRNCFFINADAKFYNNVFSSSVFAEFGTDIYDNLFAASIDEIKFDQFSRNNTFASKGAGYDNWRFGMAFANNIVRLGDNDFDVAQSWTFGNTVQNNNIFAKGEPFVSGTQRDNTFGNGMKNQSFLPGNRMEGVTFSNHRNNTRSWMETNLNTLIAENIRFENGYRVGFKNLSGGTSYTATTEDYLLCVSASTSITVSLPSGATPGSEYVIKDSSGQAATYPINVNVHGSVFNIDGDLTDTIDENRAASKYVFNGIEYIII